MNTVANAAVAVIHFGDPGPTLACLRSITDDPSPVKRTVAVVDNSGSFTSAPPGTVLVPCHHNPGFGAAANRGFEAMGGTGFDAYILMNNDVEILPGYLEAAVRALHDTRRRVGAAGGPIYLDRNLSRLWYAGGGINSLTGTVRQRTAARHAVRRRAVGFIPGTVLAVHPRAWEEVSGFDPAFFLYNEDVDLCLRLRRAGWRLLFEPDMGAIHALGETTGSREASPFYLYHLTATRLRPFRPLAYRLYLAGLHSAYVFLRAAALAAANGRPGREQARALLSAHRVALRHIAEGPRPAHDT